MDYALSEFLQDVINNWSPPKMLSRIYIDNYRCLSNFELVPATFQSMLGSNGSGKSSVFAVIKAIRDLVWLGHSTNDVFKGENLTAWDSRNVQSFELDVEGNGGVFHYRLSVAHDRIGRRSRIMEERLVFDDKPLFEAKNGLSQLFRDDFSAGPQVTLDWSQSGLHILGGRSDNTRLTWFQEWFRGCLFVSMVPSHMSSRSEEDQFDLEPGALNFASWYRHLSQERIDVAPGSPAWIQAPCSLCGRRHQTASGGHANSDERRASINGV